MKLTPPEFALMNSSVRAASQKWLETPLLIGTRRTLAEKRVLEIGCGRGVGMEILLSLGAAHVTGFDLDPAMIALAAKRVAKYGARACVSVGDAQAIDAHDASFDAVVDYGVIHYVPHWPLALKEVARVLQCPDPASGKPGGMFYFEEWLKDFVSSRLVQALFNHPQVIPLDSREFRAGLEAVGLRMRKWNQWGEWGIMGQAIKTSSPEQT